MVKGTLEPLNRKESVCFLRKAGIVTQERDAGRPASPFKTFLKLKNFESPLC